MNNQVDFFAAAATVASEGSPQTLTILLIDDEPELLRVWRMLLEMSGYRILTAQNGRDALRIALREKPSMIFCDMNMPGMDGERVLRTLRRMKPTREVPFVFLTGSVVDDLVKSRVDHLGASEFLCKPCPITRIRDVIDTLAERFDLLQENLAVAGAMTMTRRSA